MKKKASIIQEFKEFISRGNVIDLAVGVIMGSAFTAIVNSLVKDIFMPFIGWLTGGTNFAEWKYVITPAIGDTPENAVLYGSFIQNIINFLLIAIVIFLMVKGINALRRKKEAEPETPKPSEEIQLLSEIRDLLKK